MLCNGVQSPRRRSREKAILLTILLVCGMYWGIFGKYQGPGFRLVGSETPRRSWREWEWRSAANSAPDIAQELVVASTKNDDTSWLFKYFPDWQKSIYVVDDKNADLTVELNKGRESMVYLTYIIDNYNRLPDRMLFIHSQRYQWHNDDPYYDGVPMLRRVQTRHLHDQGYVNLRCSWILGCPAEIRPHTDSHREDVHAGEYFKTGFMQLFPGVEVPREVGASCCAQFGVTRWRIQQRPKSDYIRFREWLAETDLPDELSGRIMEYSWHMIFGKPSVHCPTAEECYCKVFGLCDLSCRNQWSCEERYVLPPYSNLPDGWPFVGWNGQKQDPSQGLPRT